ncbi:hypothetical protein [Streptomyces sp. NPDC047829]|uniref:hypothetical protein n=1 Tax=Streptomyces sp. NPDC047829 TaxID=3154609 RepID=UPI0033DE3FAD
MQICGVEGVDGGEVGVPGLGGGAPVEAGDGVVVVPPVHPVQDDGDEGFVVEEFVQGPQGLSAAVAAASGGVGVAGQPFEQHVLGGAVDGFDGAFQVRAVGRQDDQFGAELFERLVHALAQEVTAAVGADLAGDAAEGPVVIRAEDGVAGSGQDGVLAGLVGRDGQPADDGCGVVDEPGDPGFAAAAVDVDEDAGFDVVRLPDVVAVAVRAQGVHIVSAAGCFAPSEGGALAGGEFPIYGAVEGRLGYAGRAAEDVVGDEFAVGGCRVAMPAGQGFVHGRGEGEVAATLGGVGAVVGVGVVHPAAYRAPVDVEPGGDGTDIVVSEAVCVAQAQQSAYGGGAQ